MNPNGKDTQEVDLTIVIPCLNEEKNICDTLDTVATAMKDLPWQYEILVIDDGSIDLTYDIVSKYCREHPNIRVQLHKNPENRGLTRCYVDGAFLGSGKYYRLVCGDNVEPAETLVTIFRELGKADLIIPYHPSVPGKSALRLRISQAYTSLVNAFSGHKIRYYNGMPVTLRYNVMRWGPYSFGFGFQAELITRLLDEGKSFIEIPVFAIHREKTGSNSALNWRNFLSVGHTLLEVLIRRVRKRAFQR